MAIANMNVKLNSSIEKVWAIVTSLENYRWRSDLSKIEVLEEGKKFIEYTKDGYSTTFMITTFEPFKQYEFNMENDNMQGHWKGIFEKNEFGTSIDFTEDVIAKKVIIKPFVGIYLKKQQKNYIADLKKELGE